MNDPITPIRRLIGLLNSHAELIEALYYEREQYVSSQEAAELDRLQMLRRERVVQLVPDSSGGMTARLRSDVRRLLNTALNKQRLQSIGVDVGEMLERLDILVDRWRYARQKSDWEQEEALADEMTEVIEDVEQQYSEQLESLNERISAHYGYADQREQRGRDFAFYRKRLDLLYEGGTTLLFSLEGEDYADVPPLVLLTERMRVRFRRHGNEIRRLQRELERHIAAARARQAHTREWVRRVALLRERGGQITWQSAQARAHACSAMHRPTPIALSGHPDWDDGSTEATLEQVMETLFVSRRRSINRGVERLASGEERIDKVRMASAKQAFVDQLSLRWDAVTWLNAFFKEAVEVARSTSDATNLSAMAFWRYRVEECGEAPHPTPRAWVNEVMQLALMNRFVGQERFSKQFELHLDPSDVLQDNRGEPLRDVRVQVRPSVLS